MKTKQPDLYFCINGTFYKIKPSAHQTLCKYITLKRQQIIADYNEWLRDQQDGGVNEIVFPRIAVDDKFFNRLQAETKVKIRCIEIFTEPNKNHRLINIMGVGFYNEQIHKQITEQNPTSIPELQELVKSKNEPKVMQLNPQPQAKD